MTEANPINLSAPAAVNYLVMDNNDTTRMTANAPGTASGFATFYPYGEPGNGATSAEYGWTNQIRESNGVDHFWRRDYASQLARWLSPDPAGLAAVSLTNPQTWNEYSYVLNDPASATDAEGLLTTFTPVSPWEEDDPSARWFSTLEFGNLMPIVDPATPLPHPGSMGGGGTGSSGNNHPSCAAQASGIGLRGLSYGTASMIWSSAGLGSYSNDASAARIAALLAVTWYGESRFQITPVNNQNRNAQGVVTSVDYGPMQINRLTWNHAPHAVFGTAGGGEHFNGSPAANIAYAANRFKDYFLPRYGPLAAGAYNSADGIQEGLGLTNPSAQARQAIWSTFSPALLKLFSDQACFSHS